jgi:hypothetical protein
MKLQCIDHRRLQLLDQRFADFCVKRVNVNRRSPGRREQSAARAGLLLLSVILARHFFA